MARRRVNFVHPLLRARDYQNRPEFDDLCDWWRRGGQGVCALVGIGGAGKTAVADRFLRVLPGAMADDPNLPKDDTLPKPAALFVFSFYDAPNPDKFVAELAAWLEDRPPDDPAKTYSYQQTVRLLQYAGDCLLVLDGLEKVQDPGLRGGAFGQITDGHLRDFVLRVADGYLPGVRVIITTRFRLYDPLAERSPLYRAIRVEQLDPRTAVALLRKRGVQRGTHDQLEAVACHQGLHALSVDLAGGYIAHFCEGDPTRLPPDPHGQPAAAADATLDPQLAAIREQERKFARLAERYTEALSQSDPAAMALLQRVCLFRLGVEAKTLASIFTGEGKEGISGPELAKLSFEGVGSTLQKLAAMRLIEASGTEKAEDSSFTLHPSSFSVHPAVRDGFLAGLDAETAKRGHDAAREGLEASLGGQPGDDPSDPATLDLLEEIVYHTLAAGHAQEAWDIYKSRIGHYQNLGWRLGAYERGERICRAFVAGQPPQSASLPDGLSEDDQAVFINEWPMYLLNLGRLDAAAHCLERNIEMRMAQEDWENASRGNLNLADVLLWAGRRTAGLRAAEEALRLAERADDAVARLGSHAYRGHAKALRGETDAALADFRDALRWKDKADVQIAGPLHGLPGIWHSLLLVCLGREVDAVQLAEAGRDMCDANWSSDNPWTPCYNLLLAGLARERGDLPGARKLQAEAHDWAIARDAKEPLCWSALVRARIELSAWALPAANLGRATDSPAAAHPAPAPKAIGDAIEDGLRIARDCGYGVYHIDLLLLRARVGLREGRPAEAERDVRLALDEGVHPPADTGLPELLAATDEECGYAWGIAEGRHLLAEALLLQAAQKLGSRTYKPRSRKTPPEVRNLIKPARLELQKCIRLRKRIQDPKVAESEMTLAALGRGRLTGYPLTPTMREVKPVTLKRPDIETDPVLRSDPLWAALEKAILALTEEPSILYEKKHEWEDGLNSETINRLANEAGLRGHDVFQTGEEHEGANVTEQWLKVFHPDVEEPVRLTTWHRYSLKRASQARIDRLVIYLRAWQERRAEQLRRAAQSDEALDERRSESVAKKHLLLSYCHDNANEVTKLRDDLIAAGEAVWWDQDILPGEDWKFAIRQAMKDSYAVVLCLSKETETRATSGIFPEALDAIAAYREYAPGGIFLIPVRLSKCKIPPFEIDGTRTLDRLQYVDLFPAAKRSAGLQRLIQSLQATPHHP